MVLTKQEITVFYKLWYALVWGINEKHEFVPRFQKPVYGQSVSKEPFIVIREEIWKKPELITEFIQDNEYGDFTEAELGILADWRDNFVKDKFIIVKHLTKYSIFMTFEDTASLYAVHGITDPISEAVPYPIPLMVEAVLLPFNDKIIYDSLIGAMRVSFGKGMISSIKESYDKAKEKTGIIEDIKLPPQPITVAKKKASKRHRKKPSPLLILKVQTFRKACLSVTVRLRN